MSTFPNPLQGLRGILKLGTQADDTQGKREDFVQTDCAVLENHVLYSATPFPIMELEPIDTDVDESLTTLDSRASDDFGSSGTFTAENQLLQNNAVIGPGLSAALDDLWDKLQPDYLESADAGDSSDLMASDCVSPEEELKAELIECILAADETVTYDSEGDRFLRICRVIEDDVGMADDPYTSNEGSLRQIESAYESLLVGFLTAALSAPRKDSEKTKATA